MHNTTRTQPPCTHSPAYFLPVRSLHHTLLVTHSLRTHTRTHTGVACLSLVLCDDAHIRHLNSLHRGKDAATDVLSFELGDELDYRVSGGYIHDCFKKWGEAGGVGFFSFV